MGEVYRARDTRLDRTVAVKILPQQLSNDPVRKQRFEREAKTISGLNHPNICVLYDVGTQDGVDYLVMECVEGETLAKRLGRGPLPLEQVLKYGAQIADGLDKAHRNGVVHRDLKPSNIVLSPTGAKLLDFGLAKPATPLASGVTLPAAVPTSPVTQEGTIVGTFQYMSPEQVECKEVDARSDIFSLGAVLYEMLAGQKAFEGKSQLSVASAILEREPESIGSLKPMTPPTLEHTIKKCLAKLPDERWQSASDLASQLRWIAESDSRAGARVMLTPGGRMREWIAWSVASVAVVGALALGFTRMRQEPPTYKVLRYTVNPPEQGKFLFGGAQQGPIVSPDGQQIALIARAAGVEQIWVKPADSLQARALPGTDGANTIFWSPDSRNIAFISGGTMKKVSLSGGLPRTICDTDGAARGGAWNRQGVILFGVSPGPIFRVSANGGTPERLTTLDSKRQDFLHRWPAFLPDGNHFLYLASATASTNENSAVFAGSLDGNASKFLFNASSPVAYANGYLLYLSGETLMARPFDLEKLEFGGDAKEVTRGVLSDPYFGAAAFSVSENGVLVYQQGRPFNGYTLEIVDRSGRHITSLDEPGLYFSLRFSPDGKRICYHSPDLLSAKFNVFVWDLAAGSRTRITFNELYNRGPVWSPDGGRLAFVGSQIGSSAIFIKALNSLGAEQKITELNSAWALLTQWTPDGKNLLLEDSTADSRRLRIVIAPVDGKSPPETLLESPEAIVSSGSVSPDGRWLAYRSTETGRSEVYVTSFPKPSGRLQISRTGGGAPRWRPDGKEIFYIGEDHQIMAAELRAGEGGLQVVSLHALFQAQTLSSMRSPHYDVTADGTRVAFLAVTNEQTEAPLNVVVNWDAELKKK
jgi:Tol biopolymer transport system component